MESQAFNPTFLKSRNTIWRTISSRDHALISSSVIEETQTQPDAIDVASDEEVSTQAPATIHTLTIQQLHLAPSFDSNMRNEITILHPRDNESTFLALSSDFNTGNEITILHPRDHESTKAVYQENTQKLNFEEPKIGVEFLTEDAAYKFYNVYAYHVGFSIRRNLIRKNTSGVLTMRTFTCSKEGYYRERPNQEQPKKEHLDVRTGCNAHMRINLSEKGVYIVKSFEPKHNHVTTTPSKRKLLRSQREISDAEKANADIADSAGLKPKQTYDLLAKQAGGRKHLCFLPTDYKNYLRSKRMHDMALGDAGALMQYLQKRVKEDPAFYYAVQLDEDDQITNIFWADGRSLLDYDCFGDVVCFDTTYKTNGYGRPFAPFFGVNHHKQTVVFAGALLYDEKVESFEWLFQTFTHAVGGKAPKVILTDQDAAMSKAIEIVWPSTTHRLCVWNMYQNAAKHLSNVFSGSKYFERDFSFCVYDCEDEKEFFGAWNDMLKKYDLYGNTWLKDLFENRTKWALVYGRQVFCADMKSTQRSESMNSVNKRFLDPKQRLLDFFNHYERLLEERRQAELISDFYANQGTPRVEFSDMLKQAASILTPSVYKVFRAEYGCFLNCAIYDCGTNGTLHTYIVTSGDNEKKRERTVRCDLSNDSITCSCLKFEFVGVQCCHVIKVLDTMNIKQLPEKFFLNRWRKDAKVGRAVPVERVDELNPRLDMANRYSSLIRTYNSLLSRASQSHRTYKYANEFAKQFMLNIEAILLEEGAEKILSNGTSAEDKEQCEKVSPHTAKSKASSKVPRGIIKNDRGRGRKRFKGGLEENNKKDKRKNKVIEHTSKQCMLLESQNNKSLSMESSRNLTTPPFYFMASSIFGFASELLNTVESLSDVN